MSEDNDEATEAKPKTSDVVTTKVNVAFPFSQIKVQEPSDELVELAGLVSELADLVAEIAPESTAPDLATRAQALVARLQ